MTLVVQWIRSPPCGDTNKGKDVMNSTTVGIGIATLLFGIYSLYLRITRNDKFEKLKDMQNRFGEKNGGLMHLLLYCIAPAIFGIIMIIAGRKGFSMF